MPLIVMSKAQVDARPGPIVPPVPHFSARELRCPCCGALRVRTELLAALERWRGLLGHPLVITSGYRCPRHNAAAGGARGSQHMRGTAADVRPEVLHTRVQALRLFSGLGWDRAGQHAGLVRHVDVRHVLGGSASTVRPATWTYPR